MHMKPQAQILALSKNSMYVTDLYTVVISSVPWALSERFHVVFHSAIVLPQCSPLTYRYTTVVELRGTVFPNQVLHMRKKESAMKSIHVLSSGLHDRKGDLFCMEIKHTHTKAWRLFFLFPFYPLLFYTRGCVQICTVLVRKKLTQEISFPDSHATHLPI